MSSTALLTKYINAIFKLTRTNHVLKNKKMINVIYFLLFILGSSDLAYSQEKPLSPKNNPADISLLQSETSRMSWFMIRDSSEIKIGEIKTKIHKEKEKTLIVTTVTMQSPGSWVDTTIVKTKDFEPIYHSSYNQQRDMVLKFDQKITGYYLDKMTNTKTQLSEEINKSFFDSNFYPQLIRLLPLENGYTNTISIFDFNPKSKTGVITATITNTEKATLNHNKMHKEVWKVDTTDDISNNSAISSYYIDISTRKVLQQEVNFGGAKMIMKLIE